MDSKIAMVRKTERANTDCEREKIEGKGRRKQYVYGTKALGSLGLIFSINRYR